MMSPRPDWKRTEPWKRYWSESEQQIVSDSSGSRMMPIVLKWKTRASWRW
jgi:hypothetical protein